ncbi:hypothetical protein NDK50_09565 [Paraburkholderia bryophila]|uniref:hypothetical protein n=1 Tax=Paraburkholderia bryophila TaxID=420952 RepID=UPI00234B716A|nr:hypothetical protein [Paraburkholderia bryophila]WCM22062.1 hypothetical protein NDK50_09565 [Paraburkholderia bryophila]
MLGITPAKHNGGRLPFRAPLRERVEHISPALFIRFIEDEIIRNRVTKISLID